MAAAAAAAATARRPESRIQIRPVTGQCMPDSAPITTRVSRPELARRRSRPSLASSAMQGTGTVNSGHHSDEASNVNQPRHLCSVCPFRVRHPVCVCAPGLCARSGFVSSLAPHRSVTIADSHICSWIRIVSLVCLSIQLRGRIYVPSSEPSLGVGSCKFVKTKTSLKHTPVALS